MKIEVERRSPMLATAGALTGPEEEVATPRENPPRGGRVMKVLAALWTLALLFVPGLGLTDVVESLIPGAGPGKMVTTAYAIVVGGILPASLLLLLLRPPAGTLPALRQVAAGAAAFALAGLLALRPQSALGAGFLVVVVLTTRAAHPLRAGFARLGRRSLTRADAVLGAGAVAWLVQAVAAGASQRAGLPPREGFGLGLDSWDAISLLGLTVFILVLLALRSPGGRRLHAGCAGAASLAFGLLSLWRTGIPGSLPLGWAIAAGAWGGAVIGLAAASGRGSVPEPSTDPDRSGGSGEE